MSIINKMNKSDWMFLILYIFGVFLVAFILGIVFDLVNGGITMMMGSIFGGVILRNRIQSRKGKK